MADNYFDPTEDAPVRNDTRSADASKGGVRAAWDEFSSKPENNAALIQFGIAMMQPRPQGQSSLGQFGNAIGYAGEASSGNIAAQNQEKDREAQRMERESTAGYRDKQGEAAMLNAKAYGKIADAQGSGGAGSRQALSQVFRTQQAFRTWLAKPEDITGLQQDPLLGAIQKEFPHVKTKADLVKDQKAQQRAYQLYTQQFATEAPDDPAAAAAPAASAQPANPGVAAPMAPGAPLEKYNAQGKGVRYNPATRTWDPIN